MAWKTINELLNSDGNLTEKKALFIFNSKDSDDKVILKFNLWTRYFFPQYFQSEDAEFHKQIDLSNLRTYRGNEVLFIDIAFRGAAKTARTKLFIGFVIANDLDHYRKYIKILSADGTNSKQIVTDIYNMFVQPRVKEMYPEVFKKTEAKREETMSSFTTYTGVKVLSDTVGTEQRGAIQEDSRPDLIWFEDFESRKTLRSAVITKAIWDNMEEARTGLAKGGSCIYTCNYISERGNVHTLVTKEIPNKILLIIPIIKDSILSWPQRYTLDDVERMKQTDDDFEGERLCKPSAGKDVLFDRSVLDRMESKEPLREVSGFKMFRIYDPSHKYGSGHDTAGGVGLDSSTSVFIDFETYPAQVVATFKSNTIKPDIFGDEIKREVDYYGGNLIIGIENNKYDQVILKARQLGLNLYTEEKKGTEINTITPPKKYGWNTNSLTKPKMLFALVKAVNDGHLILNDKDLIQECKSYSRDDLMDREEDPRLTTRHFDLLIACAIAWQMKDYAFTPIKDYAQAVKNYLKETKEEIYNAI